MNGIPWTKEEDEYLKRVFANTRTNDIAAALGVKTKRVCSRAYKLGLKKSNAYIKKMHKASNGQRRSKATEFKKGMTPANKGMKGYDAGGRSHETRFKKGLTPPNAVPVGTVRIDSDGYAKVKIQKACGGKNWKQVQNLTWEKHYGEIPKGCIIIFKNRNKRDVRIENLECVTRAELMRRNSIHNYPKEIVRAQAQLSALNRKIRQGGKNG